MQEKAVCGRLTALNTCHDGSDKVHLTGRLVRRSGRGRVRVSAHGENLVAMVMGFADASEVVLRGEMTPGGTLQVVDARSARSL